MSERTLLQTALAAARAAARVHHDYRGRIEVRDWTRKGVADFVTRVDREAEQRIVEVVRTRFPDHDFLVEEGSAGGVGPHAIGRIADHEWLWIADPLDGTTNYLHGYPAYAASVAVARRGRLLAGAVVAAASGEEWTASAGGGAFLNGEPIRTSAIDRLDHALIGTGFPFKARQLLPAYLRQLDAVLRQSAGVRRAGSAALDLCHVATGYFDGFWELDLLPWDVAAGALVVREAGGVAQTLEGSEAILRQGSILAGNVVIAEQLRAAIARETRAGSGGPPGGEA
jgi:myo-inositol-1(or 4)-monophosphatase